MMIRTHIFRVSPAKKKEMLRYMNGEVRQMMLGKPGLPGCLEVYFVRNRKRKNEYAWVSVWENEALFKRHVLRRKEWQEVGRREKEIFSGKHPMIHYDVLWHRSLKKKGRKRK